MIDKWGIQHYAKIKQELEELQESVRALEARSAAQKKQIDQLQMIVEDLRKQIEIERMRINYGL